MPRKAREKMPYSTYLIQQNCTQAKMFCNDNEIAHFILSLTKAQRQYACIIIGLSLFTSGYKMILFDNGTDISKIMRTINIGYALGIDRKSFKLKERFQSEIIPDSDGIYQALLTFKTLDPHIINTIENNNAKINTTQFYNRMFTHTHNFISLIGQANCLLPCKDDDCHQRIKCTHECIKSIPEGMSKLEENLKAAGLNFDEMLKNKHMRNTLILYMRQNSTLTLKKIGSMFGGMSESAVSKVIKRYNLLKGGQHEPNI